MVFILPHIVIILKGMRKILVIFTVLAFCTFAFTQEGTFDIHWFTPESVSHTLTASGKISDLPGSSDLPAFAFTAGAHTHEITFRTGLEICSDRQNITADATYTPFSWYFLDGGIRLINHCTFCPDIYSEYDLLPGLFLKLTPADWFTFSLSYLYQLKSSKVYALEGAYGNIISNDMGFDLNAAFHITNQLETTLSFSSFSFFKYYLFLSPVSSFSISYEVLPDLLIALTEQVQYIDFFTLSANLDELSTSLSLSWRF